MSPSPRMVPLSVIVSVLCYRFHACSVIIPVLCHRLVLCHCLRACSVIVPLLCHCPHAMSLSPCVLSHHASALSSSPLLRHLPHGLSPFACMLCHRSVCSVIIILLRSMVSSEMRDSFVPASHSSDLSSSFSHFQQCFRATGNCRLNFVLTCRRDLNDRPGLATHQAQTRHAILSTAVFAFVFPRQSRTIFVLR